MYWNNIEWVDPRNQDRTKNPFCNSTYKYYTKDGNESCNFVGNKKLKLIDYGTFFNNKSFSAALESSLLPTVVGEVSNNSTHTFSTCVHNKSQED